MKRTIPALIGLFLLILAGCDAYLEENLSFLELPFEYEGRLDADGYFEPDYNLKWGVPDNSDESGVYLGAYDYWGTFYVYYFNGSTLWTLINPAEPRRIASLSSRGWFMGIDGSAGSETLRLYYADLSTMTWASQMNNLVSAAFSGESRLLAGAGDLCYVGNPQSNFMLREATVSTGSSSISAYNVLLPPGSVTLSAVIAQAFPEADATWGTPTVDFQAFAPASVGSPDGKHKFIISRRDAISGTQKTVLVSIDETSFAFTTRVIDADHSFNFVSRDRFVGMKGSTLQIFNAAGDLLKSYALEGMRLLGYRSETDQELVFLYTSDENHGDRVYGIYSLPAEFVKEAR